VQEAEGAHECLLGRVVGVAHAGDDGGRAPSVVLVAAHQLAVRLDVSLLGLLDQLEVVRGAPSPRPLCGPPLVLHRRQFQGSDTVPSTGG
jgi:hypothetical protein